MSTTDPPINFSLEISMDSKSELDQNSTYTPALSQVLFYLSLN